MLVDGSSSVARRLKLPESMISFTVVALGTSLPKLFTVLLAAYNGFFDLALGTILGSCIFNFLGVLPITGFTRPIRATKNTATIGILSLVAAALMLYFMANKTFFPPAPTQLFISKYEAAILILMFILFMTYGYFNVKKHHVIWFSEGEEPPAYYMLWFSIILMIVGFIGLIAGGVLVVDNLIDISRKYDFSQKFLGQFLLSFGGSAVMLYWFMMTKAKESKFEISNLVGQNMLNILGMLGISAFIQPVQYNRAFNIDIFILIGISLLIMGMLWMGKKLTLNLYKCRFLFLFLIVYVIYLFGKELY
ncbi:MAG: Na+/Ca+ antiporter, CaCA family [Bacteroidota bacterium]|nr:Na+/Ca+ antiporter, CaCA family [Bacteroidota bacterium]